MPSGFRTFVGFALLFLACFPVAAMDRSAVAVLSKTAPGKRVALVLGNGAYEHAPQLSNPENDAKDMAALLSGIGFDVVDGVNLDKREMEERIRTFAEKVSDAAVTLFYYAGHGMQVDGRNYLIPTDAVLKDRTSLEFETIEVDTVLRYMVATNRIAIALLDACRDNPMSRRFTSTRSASVGTGLAMPETGGGIMIGFATAPGETAADGDGRNSPFAKALLTHLGTPNIEISQTMRRVMADVSAITGDRQRPWVHSDIAVDFFMLPTVAPAPSQSAPVAPQPETAGSTPSDTIKLASRGSSAGEAQAVEPATPSRVFGVFEKQNFDLCGFKAFSAVLLPKGGATAAARR